MKKTIILFIIVLICGLAAIPITAHAESVDGINYRDNGDGTCTITGGLPPPHWDVPSTLNGLTVTHINLYAFDVCWGLYTINFPSTLRYIGPAAFKSTNDLAEIHFPDGVEYIGYDAFNGFGVLGYVKLPSSLTYIGESAFRFNYSLPYGYGDWVQLGTGNIYPGGSSVSRAYSYALNDFKSDRNVDGTCRITQYIGSMTAMDLPDTLKGYPISFICEQAFNGKNINSVVLGPHVKYIGAGAFSNNNISSITFPENITEIGIGAFSNNGTSEFTLPAGDWFVYDADGFTGDTASGGDVISGALGYAKSNNKPRRIGSVSATTTETQLTNDTYTLDLSTIFTDDYFDTLNYEVGINGADFIDALENYSFITTEARDYTLIFRAFDGKEYSDDTYTVTITSRPLPDFPPSRKPGVPEQIDESIGATYPYHLDLSKIFQGIEGYAISYQVDINSGGYVDANEQFSYTPATVGDHVLIFRAYNGKYSTETFQVNLTALPVQSMHYNKNGATSGSVPTDAESPYILGSEVTVLKNTKLLAKSEYIFNGWNTRPDGSGVHFPADNPGTFTILTDTTLYAEWVQPTITSGGTYNISNFPLLTAGNTLRIATTEPVTLTGTSPGSDAHNGVRILCDENTNLTINDLTNNSSRSPLVFTGTNNKLFLDGTNTLSSGNNSAGIQVSADVELVIDTVESAGGILNITAGNRGAGIGGNEYHNCGTITINGGTITAEGGSYASGIGGGYTSDNGTITINGGDITAIGNGGAGIGGGFQGCGSEITINGGQIIASAQGDGAAIGDGGSFSMSRCHIKINGGDIRATGNTAGIGGNGGTVADNSIIITGGTIEAHGGDYHSGIGYDYSSNGTVTISGGDITVTGGKSAAGISGGNKGYITITSGTINAQGGENGAGIGGGLERHCGNITISGGQLDATGGQYGAGIGSGGKLNYGGDLSPPTGIITINNSYVIARGGENAAGIGGGQFVEGGTIGISGGKTIANVGGSNTAGIGGGYWGDSGNIAISNGAIVFANVSSSDTYAIGCGRNGENNDITLSGYTTAVFTFNGTNGEQFTLADGLSMHNDPTDISTLRTSLNLDTDPWMNANRVFCEFSDPIVFPVTFHKNTAYTVTNMPESQTIIRSEKAILPPAPNREGFSFSGWYTEPDCITQWDFDRHLVSQATHLYAKWTRQLAVKVSAEAGGYASPNGDYVITEGDDLTFSVFPNDGFTVNAVTSTVQNDLIEDNGDGTFTIQNITSSGTINISFTPPADNTVYHSITIESGTNGSVNPVGAFTVADGENLTFTASPNTGYKVGSITSTAAATSIIKSLNDTCTVSGITSDGTVHVNFNLIDYFIDIVSGSKGSVLPSGTRKISSGDDLTIYPLPNEYYAVDAVTSTAAYSAITENDGGSYTISDLTSAGTISVSYVLPDFNVDVIAGDHGSVSPSGVQIVSSGNNLTITPAPDTGYEVDEVIASTGNTVTLLAGGDYEIQSITEPCTVNVTFKPSTFLLNYDCNGGEGSMCDEDCLYGETIVLSDGVGFSKQQAVLDCWDIGYLGGLYNISGDVTAKAVWKADSDEDGVSDDDESAAGTDPNDAEDKPQKETIKATIINDDGSFASNYTVVLNSAPQFNTTGTSGNAVFAGVYLSPHTLSLRDSTGTKEIGRYPLSFTKGSTNSSSISGGGTGVNTTNAPNFLSLELVIKLNAAKTSGIITDVAILERSYTDNPDTGEH